MRQEHEILTAIFDDGTNTVDFSINFTCDRMRDTIETAGCIAAEIAERPTDMVRFNFHADDGRDYNYYADGRDALSIVLSYFNDYVQQEVLRCALDECLTVGGQEWIKHSSYYDPDWVDEF